MPTYTGKYITGSGEERWLSLLDKSCTMLHTSGTLPGVPMLYKGNWNTFREGFIWDGWWIQNSHGFCLGANPLLGGIWHDILQNSYDLFWDRIGDGKRMGLDPGKEFPPRNQDLWRLVAPDGALGDTVLEYGIVYRQGDGNWRDYDWFYEATAAGILTQAEFCLYEHDIENAKKHLPKMIRSMNHIEEKRAPNGLFLVGPSSNLLAPSWGACYDEKQDRIVPAYLAGLTITYGAAMRAMREVAAFAGDSELAELCSARYERCVETLPLFYTKDGYLARSMDPDGTLHGVYGAKRYGYIDSVTNVDAIAYEMTDEKHAEAIYNGIASVPELRAYGCICNNYPHYDDTYGSFAKHDPGPDSTGHESGGWVDGGCWATVEGRAILSYMRLGKYEDAFRACDYYMKWAEDWRMDEPLTQWGANTDNEWAQEHDGYETTKRPVAVMVDNFAAVTCLLRGLFYVTANRSELVLRPQVPDGIRRLAMNEPFHIAGQRVFFSYDAEHAGERMTAGGKEYTPDDNGFFRISFEELAEASNSGCVTIGFGTEPAPVRDIPSAGEPDLALLPDDIVSLWESLQDQTDGFSREMKAFIVSDAERRTIPLTDGHFRPMTDAKREAVYALYDDIIREMAYHKEHSGK